MCPRPVKTAAILQEGDCSPSVQLRWKPTRLVGQVGGEEDVLDCLLLGDDRRLAGEVCQQQGGHTGHYCFHGRRVGAGLHRDSRLASTLCLLGGVDDWLPVRICFSWCSAGQRRLYFQTGLFRACQENCTTEISFCNQLFLLGHPKEGLYNSVEQKNSDV